MNSQNLQSYAAGLARAGFADDEVALLVARTQRPTVKIGQDILVAPNTFRERITVALHQRPTEDADSLALEVESVTGRKPPSNACPPVVFSHNFPTPPPRGVYH